MLHLNLLPYFLSLACTACAVAQDQVIVTYAQPNDTLSLNLTAILPSVYVPGTELVANITQHGIRLDIFAITHCTNIDPNVEWEIVCEQFKQDDTVVSCEPDEEVSLDVATAKPDDPLFPQQWALPDIDLGAVWAKGIFGSPAVRVCVIDTGLDLLTTPSDIAANLFNNPAVGANGVPGDVHGASYSKGVGSGDIQDLNGHGTFVSGVVAATTNNGLLISGVAQTATLIPCKFIGASGSGQISDALLCFNYCMLQKSHIISNSYGSTKLSPAFQDVITKAVQQGVLVVTSAGNSGLNTDDVPQYPSAFSKDNMGLISVAATSKDKTLWVNSNYGATTVQIAAPGERIIGLGLNGAQVFESGTSMATPHLAGVAALLLGDLASQGVDLATVPNLPQALRTAIVNGSVQAPLPEDQAKVPGGYLSASGAVTAFRSSALYPANSQQSGVPLSVGLYFLGVLTGIVLTAAVGYGLYVIRARVKRAREGEAAQVPEPEASTNTETMT